MTTIKLGLAVNIIGLINKNIKILLIFLLYLGVLNYSVWPQIYYVHASDLGDFNVSSYYHLPRYIVVYPAFLLNTIFPVLSIDAWFSVYVLLAFFITVNLILKIYMNYDFVSIFGINVNYNNVNFIVIFLLTPVLFFINGRGMFGILSSALLLYYLTYRPGMLIVSKIFHIFLILLLASVSSGFFVIAFMSILVNFFMKTGVLSIKSLVSMFLLVFALYSTYDIYSYVLIRNLDYYGGGIHGLVNMLNHGFGYYFLKFDTVFLYLFSLIFVFSFLSLILIVRVGFLKAYYHILCVVFLSLLVGVFGYTSLSYGIPGLVILLLLISSSRDLNKVHS